MSAPSEIEDAPQGSFLAGLLVYLRPGVLIVMLLGFSSGLPLALSGETLRVWMADRGVDLGTIGLLSLAGLPYTLKFIWAPVVDAWQVPILSQLGRRRSWLIATQLLLMATIVFLGTRDPLASPLMVGIAALLVAFASATQDIVVDAYRVQSLPTDEQAAGMASYVAAYRVGMLASGAGVIGLSGWLETQGLSKEAVWPLAYAAAAVLVLVGLAATLLAREPDSAAKHDPTQGHSALLRLYETARDSFAEFLTRDAAIAVLAFVVLFKLCDALAGAMTAPYVLSLGYSKLQYATIVKGVGLASLLVGGFAGGTVARALPLATALLVGAILQSVSILAFVWLGWQEVSMQALTVAIVLENFATAIGTVIFVAYLSALCRNPLHTATQYALLTALASSGRTFFASGTGYAAEMLGWPAFFVMCVLTALPALALLAWLQRRGHFRALEADRRDVQRAG
jgi:MFS transporter, PAT family, beta-lactamase induction signal transducer AmpG